MIIERFPELMKLSEEEKWQLSCELTGHVFIDEPVTDPEIIAELDRRWQEYLRDPSTARPWSEVRKELQEKYCTRADE
jgi:putative addiction module component (TIGR02574 family)